MKTCIGCNQLFPKEVFHLQERVSLYTGKTTTYLSSYCPACNKVNCKNRRKTLKGLFSDMYSGQILSSKKRGMPAPNYSLSELEQWVRSQDTFFSLAKAWKESNFNKWLKPSCDRVDNNLPYTFANMQLMTTKENCDKYCNEVVNGTADKNLKAVHQFSVEGTFIAAYHSINEACRQTACSPGNLLRCCRGEYKTSKGYVWRYADEC